LCPGGTGRPQWTLKPECFHERRRWTRSVGRRFSPQLTHKPETTRLALIAPRLHQSHGFAGESGSQAHAPIARRKLRQATGSAAHLRPAALRAGSSRSSR
jgi:hypothetical protein